MLLSWLALVVAWVAPLPAEPMTEWTAKFRGTEGWVGGDGAFSVPLGNGRVAWLFSDTWVGSIRDNKRVNVRMVNNSVAIQEKGNLRFFYRKDEKGTPTTLFTPPDGKGWFWLFAGQMQGSRLVLFLAQIEKAAGNDAFGFRQVGQWVGVVDNPSEDPTLWKITSKKIPFCRFSPELIRCYGSSVVVKDKEAYIYGYQQEKGTGPFPRRRLIVARAAIDQLHDPDRWEFRTTDQWSKDPEAVAPTADGIGAEFSVSAVPGTTRYVLVSTEQGLSDKIIGRWADGPTGPWSESKLLYRCPEMAKDKRLFSYAGKAHPSLAEGNELVISYCVNAFELGPVINNATLYWPIFVRVRPANQP